MAIKRYGLNIGFIHNSRQILTSAGIHFLDLQNIGGGGDPSDDNFGIVFDLANFHNAISWGDITDSVNLRSLFVQDDNLVYKSIGGVDTALLDEGNANWIELTGSGETFLHNHDSTYVLKSGDTMEGALIAADHVTAATAEVPNICYGTGAAPAANTTPEGTLYITYTP
jgi:hypothetical protein